MGIRCDRRGGHCHSGKVCSGANSCGRMRASAPTRVRAICGAPIGRLASRGCRGTMLASSRERHPAANPRGASRTPPPTENFDVYREHSGFAIRFTSFVGAGFIPPGNLAATQGPRAGRIRPLRMTEGPLPSLRVGAVVCPAPTHTGKPDTGRG